MLLFSIRNTMNCFIRLTQNLLVNYNCILPKKRTSIIHLLNRRENPQSIFIEYASFSLLSIPFLGVLFPARESMQQSIHIISIFIWGPLFSLVLSNVTGIEWQQQIYIKLRRCDTSSIYI